MPELPEVETVRAQLDAKVVGRRLRAVEVLDDKFCSPIVPAAFSARIAGSRIVETGRRGKYLLFGLDSGDDLVVHLRMTGRLHWSAARPTEPERFLRATFEFDDEGVLSFADMRRFGRAWIAPGGEAADDYWRGRVGVEPLGPDFTPDLLAGLLEGRRGPIKALLLNQAIIAGIGNIYADEALFAAGIHPERPGGTLDADEVRSLHEAIVDRLKVAVRAGGASIDSYRDSLGRYGTMQDLLRVHLHRGDPCPRCADTVVKIRVAQRGTYLCPTCQVKGAPVLGDVEGVRVGHWDDLHAGTGCTVIVPPPGTVVGAETRGGGPASREFELLSPVSAVESITALVFSGGSAFGLDSASGVMRWCEEQGMGHDTGAARVPLVAAACLYDLGITGNARRPGAQEGYAAAAACAPGDHARGSVGAGVGATVGKLRGQQGWCKGGLGAASVRTHDGVTVAALAVVNSWGDVIDHDGTVLAGVVDEQGRFMGASQRTITDAPEHPRLRTPANTTLVCVATDARLSKAQAVQVARASQAGMARAVSPVHTPFDGDVAVCMATGARPVSLFVCGVAAAEVTSAAIRDAVLSADEVRGVPTGRARRSAAPPG